MPTSLRGMVLFVTGGIVLVAGGVAIGHYGWSNVATVVNAAPPATSRTTAPATSRTTFSRATTTTTSSTTPTFPASTSTTIQIAPAGVIPLNGIYTDGAAGTAHYFIVATFASTGSLSGSLQYLYQDGESSVVFTFVGSFQDGVAVFQRKTVPQVGAASQKPSTIPSVISVLYTATSLQLGECTSYLHLVQAESQCQFSFSSSGSPGD